MICLSICSDGDRWEAIDYSNDQPGHSGSSRDWMLAGLMMPKGKKPWADRVSVESLNRYGLGVDTGDSGGRSS